MMISINLKSQEPSGSQPREGAQLAVRSAFWACFVWVCFWLVGVFLFF